MFTESDVQALDMSYERKKEKLYMELDVDFLSFNFPKSYNNTYVRIPVSCRDTMVLVVVLDDSRFEMWQ